jgi:hypothetical protein
MKLVPIRRKEYRTPLNCPQNGCIARGALAGQANGDGHVINWPCCDCGRPGFFLRPVAGKAPSEAFNG